MIPLTRPWLDEKEANAAGDAIRSGWVTQGPQVEAFERAFAQLVGSPHACAVSSCTAALSLALRVVGVQPGDVVATVSHSFIATANAVRHVGAEPLFVDIDPSTFNLSVTALAELLETRCAWHDDELRFQEVGALRRGESPLTALPEERCGRVAAVLAVHQLGMPCDLVRLLELTRRFKLPLVEDAACAVGSSLRDAGGQLRPIGLPHGDVACFSFHPRKVVTTGEGGMLTTRNEEFDRRFRLWRHHGMSMSDRARHTSRHVAVERYICTGYNYRMSDVQAAIGIQQLKKLPAMIERRRLLDRIYRRHLADLGWLEPPMEPDYACSNWQSYAVRLLPDAPLDRDRLMQRLLDHDVACRPGIMNAHEEGPYRGGPFSLPSSERARRQSILLPFFHALDEADIISVRRSLDGP